MRDSHNSFTRIFSASPRIGVIAFVLVALTACDSERPADSAFYNRGGPESLIDVSSEVVNLSVASADDLSELSKWIEKDQPTRAELYCKASDLRCVDAQKVLDLEAVPTKIIPSGDYSVALVYERILAHDCNPRYVNNGSNFYNAYHPAFGCSIAANIVQHVSDKQQFVSPNLTDTPAAEGALQAYKRAYTPKESSMEAYSIDKSVVSSAKTK